MGLIQLTKKLLAVTILLTSSAFAANDTYERVMLYLEKNGVTNGPDLVNSYDINISVTAGEPDKIMTWNVPNVPRPTLDMLLPSDVAVRFSGIPLKHRRVIPIYPYFEIMSEAERKAVDDAEEAAKQAVKSDALKEIERKIIVFLRTEGVIAETDKKPTKDQLLHMFQIFDAMPDQDAADMKRFKYQSLKSRLELAGGNELDVYDHPAP